VCHTEPPQITLMITQCFQHVLKFGCHHPQ
jgi:hypothetical protein